MTIRLDDDFISCELCGENDFVEQDKESGIFICKDCLKECEEKENERN